MEFKTVKFESGTISNLDDLLFDTEWHKLNLTPLGGELTEFRGTCVFVNECDAVSSEGKLFYGAALLLDRHLDGENFRTISLNYREQESVTIRSSDEVPFQMKIPLLSGQSVKI